MILRVILFCLLAPPLWADSVVPTRTIRAHVVITPDDVAIRQGAKGGGYLQLSDVIGQETRVALYPGRVIRVGDIGPPAIVARNQLVRVSYLSRGLQIVTEGRALERGAIGDRLRIMNLSSRSTVIGQVRADGSIAVSP